MNLRLTKIFQRLPEGGFVAFVEELPGANTQGNTLDEAKSNLEEAIELVLEANRTMSEEMIAGQEVIREAVTLSAA
jgi:predicted RNase H-like HicB family nuclease